MVAALKFTLHTAPKVRDSNLWCKFISFIKKYKRNWYIKNKIDITSNTQYGYEGDESEVVNHMIFFGNIVDVWVESSSNSKEKLQEDLNGLDIRVQRSVVQILTKEEDAIPSDLRELASDFRLKAER